MTEIGKLAARLADNAALHQKNIKHLETLLKIAKLAISPEEVGQVLRSLNKNLGSWEETRDYVKVLQERTDDIFFTWAIAARLEHIEHKGETK